MEAAVEEHRRHLDDILYAQQDALEQYADTYASKLEKLEVPVQHSIGETAYNFGLSVANPYTMILIAYVVAVAVQLYFVTRSAMRGRQSTINTQSTRVNTFLGLAVVSLLTTWYNMFAYLLFSYNAFIERTTLAGDEITSIPSCEDGLRCALAQATAHSMRVAQWLRNSLLFQEAWFHVVQTPFNWFWSVEVCLFAVGVWALFLTVQAKRFNVPHAWAYMLLGQTCAMSVAQNLFYVALTVRATSTQASRRSSMSAKSDVDLMPPPASPATRSKVLQKTPSVLSRIIYLVLALFGLALVYRVPSDVTTLLAMHAAPFLITLPIFASSSVLSSVDGYIQLSTIYALVALATLAVRAKTIFDALANSPEQVINILFAHPGQLSISFDAICITLSTMSDFALRGHYLYSIATLFLGPSAALAISLAFEERQLEAGSARPTKPRSSNGRISASNAAKTESATPVKRRKSTKASSADGDAAVAATSSQTPKRTRKSTTTRSRKSTNAAGGEATTDGGETTDGNASEAPSITGTPADRAKKSRSRPRKVLDASDVEGALSDVSASVSPAKKPRSRRKSTTTTTAAASDSDTAATTRGAKGTGRARGRPRKVVPSA